MKNCSNSLKFIINLTKFQVMLSRRLDSALGGLGLNEFIILFELEQAAGKLRRIDLAARIGLTASGITRLLLPMEKIGLVSREANENDARSSFVILAPGGKLKLSEGLERAELFCEEIFPEDKTQSLEELALFLKRLTGMTSILNNASEFAQEAKARWGDTEAYKQSQEKFKSLSKAELEKINLDNETLLKQIVEAMTDGPASDQVQELIAQHYDRLRLFYEPNLTMYRGLGDMYVADPRFSAYYEKFQSGLAQFMKEAINVYCDQRAGK